MIVRLCNFYAILQKTEIVRQEAKALDKQIETVVREFTKQAESFNEYQKIFSKEEYTRFAIDHMQLNGNEKVLEVAAGTCAFGRAVAPLLLISQNWM